MKLAVMYIKTFDVTKIGGHLLYTGAWLRVGLNQEYYHRRSKALGGGGGGGGGGIDKEK